MATSLTIAPRAARAGTLGGGLTALGGDGGSGTTTISGTAGGPTYAGVASNGFSSAGFSAAQSNNALNFYQYSLTTYASGGFSGTQAASFSDNSVTLSGNSLAGSPINGSSGTFQTIWEFSGQGSLDLTPARGSSAAASFEVDAPASVTFSTTTGDYQNFLPASNRPRMSYTLQAFSPQTLNLPPFDVILVSDATSCFFGPANPNPLYATLSGQITAGQSSTGSYSATLKFLGFYNIRDSSGYLVSPNALSIGDASGVNSFEDFAAIPAAPIPEPATVLPVAVGLIGLAGLGLRRRERLTLGKKTAP